MKYQKLPTTIEAVQFTGDNWAEMHAFTGHVRINDVVMDVFRGGAQDTMLWVAANQSWLPIEISEWVAKDKLGFYPIKDEQFKLSYVEEDESDILLGPDADTDIPVLDEDAEDARIIGRVRMALLLTRPESEADLISERVLKWCARYRVTEERPLAGLPLQAPEKYDSETMTVVRDAMHAALFGNRGIVFTDNDEIVKMIDDQISYLQNAGILFRERG